MVCAGIHMSDIPTFPYSLLWEERQLVSVANLTRRDAVDFLEVAPRAGVVTFHFSPASGIAEANTRVRLATTQNITAVAKMNDGSVFAATMQVKVTIGGCGG